MEKKITDEEAKKLIEEFMVKQPGWLFPVETEKELQESIEFELKQFYNIDWKYTWEGPGLYAYYNYNGTLKKTKHKNFGDAWKEWEEGYNKFLFENKIITEEKYKKTL